ncbi:unnamed protein product [Pleuronectes platessa]|uniref:Uncharacterized protein n=1 Tax=Pleuronectes platessa TaxID=8262 RepID=A0A9N7UHU0_PLEPL|nr:unnamed protein product [Pleuronectes platessa]
MEKVVEFEPERTSLLGLAFESHVTWRQGCFSAIVASATLNKLSCSLAESGGGSSRARCSRWCREGDDSRRGALIGRGGERVMGLRIINQQPSMEQEAGVESELFQRRNEERGEKSDAILRSSCFSCPAATPLRSGPETNSVVNLWYTFCMGPDSSLLQA